MFSLKLAGIKVKIQPKEEKLTTKGIPNQGLINQSTSHLLTKLTN